MHILVENNVTIVFNETALCECAIERTESILEYRRLSARTYLQILLTVESKLYSSLRTFLMCSVT